MLLKIVKHHQAKRKIYLVNASRIFDDVIATVALMKVFYSFYEVIRSVLRNTFKPSSTRSGC